jgi:transcriptional antiterminator RfaH
MAFWACAQLQPQRERLALHCLALEGFEVYLPRLRQMRRQGARKVESSSPLFPGYLFVRIVLQWRKAHWGPGVIGLIMDGGQPARVPVGVLDEIRAREVRGLVVLPSKLKPGDSVRIVHGVLAGRLALFDGMAAHERVMVLLSLLGGARRLTLPREDIEVV